MVSRPTDRPVSPSPTNNDYLMDLTATYMKDFGNHSLTVLAGYSFQQFNSEWVSAGNQDFITDGFLYNNLGAGNFAKPSVGSGASKTSLGSYFGRINYSYLSRYLLTLTMRADGASNFDQTIAGASSLPYPQAGDSATSHLWQV